MMQLYKLTNKDGRSPDGLQWGPQVTHNIMNIISTPWPGGLDAYLSPWLAVLMAQTNNFSHFRLWESSGVVKSYDGLRIWAISLTTIREIPIPEVTTTMRVSFAILAAKAVYHDTAWQLWAEQWLSGADRSAAACAKFMKPVDNPSTCYAAAQGAAISASKADLIMYKSDGVARDLYLNAIRRLSIDTVIFANSCRQNEISPDFVSIANEAMKH